MQNVYTDYAHPLTSASNVSDLCKPLFNNTFVNFFEYCHYNLVSGGGFTLTNNANAFKALLNHSLYVVAAELNAFVQNNLKYGFVSHAIPLPDVDINMNKMKKNIMVFAQSFQIYHRFYILDYKDNIAHLYGFGTSVQSETAIYSFLSNIDLFEKFITYFHRAGEKLLEDAHKNSHHLPCFLSPTDSLQQIDENLLRIDRIKLINEMLEHRQGQDLNKKSLITPQEAKILQYIPKGLSYKEIATELDISSRTIESHIQNIKQKLGITRKSDLRDFSKDFF